MNRILASLAALSILYTTAAFPTAAMSSELKNNFNTEHECIALDEYSAENHNKTPNMKTEKIMTSEKDAITSRFRLKIRNKEIIAEDGTLEHWHILRRTSKMIVLINNFDKKRPEFAHFSLSRDGNSVKFARGNSHHITIGSCIKAEIL